MFKVNASDFSKVLDYAMVGGDEGFLLNVSPEMKQVGDVQMQIATVICSDADKKSAVNIAVEVSGMEGPESFYVSSKLKAAVMTMAKLTDTIVIEVKKSFLELSDQKKETVIKVELVEKFTVLELPGENPENDASEEMSKAVFITMECKKMAEAVRVGGFASSDKCNIAGANQIGFYVDAENKTLSVYSAKNTVMCKAVTDIDDVMIQSQDENSEYKAEWHKINYKFIQNMVQKISGDYLQVAFTPHLMIVQTESAIYASKKSFGSIVEQVLDKFDEENFVYQGVVEKKALLLAMEVALTGADSDKRLFSLETNNDGTLLLKSFKEGNKACVVQKMYEGKMEKKLFMEEFLKLILNACGDEVQYRGKNGEKELLYFTGNANGVKSDSILFPYVYKNK